MISFPNNHYNTNNHQNDLFEDEKEDSGEEIEDYEKWLSMNLNRRVLK